LYLKSGKQPIYPGMDLIQEDVHASFEKFCSIGLYLIFDGIGHMSDDVRDCRSQMRACLSWPEVSSFGPEAKRCINLVLHASKCAP